MAETDQHDTRAKAEGGEQPLSAKFWINELKAAGKREAPWHKRAKAVVELYRDEREKNESSEQRTNILWSNTEVLKSVLFQGLGNPDVRRRFPRKGKEERAAKQAALVLEHSLSYCADVYNSTDPVECAIEDVILPGRGQCWVVYDAEVTGSDPELPESENDTEEMQAAEIADQSVRIEHVYWEDYRTSAGRKESDIWWKARRHHYSRDEMKEYFPEHWNKVPLESKISDGYTDDSGDDADTFKRADIWEIWDKTKRQRLYVCEGYQFILRRDDDPYELREFFPCPAALYGCKTTSSLVPIPEYTLYQDQATELDKITTRLNRLIDALKRRGVYDASLEGPDNQLSQLADADDNEFLPYKGFSTMMEKGGLKAAFQTEDLGPIIAVVEKLYQQRMMLVQTIYEVTGISDVIRGASNPNETATAQRIKGQFGSLRIQKRQGAVNNFIRDLYRIKAEIIAEHFTREKLEEMSGLMMPTRMDVERARNQLKMLQQQQMQAEQAAQMGHNGGPPMGQQMPAPAMPQPDPEMIQELQETAKAVPWEDVEAILRSDARRGYKVDIETDATAQTDEQMEKQNRIEFLTTMQAFMERIIPAVVQMPQMAPLAKELVLFGVKAFKVGRSLEETFDDVFDQLSKLPPPQQQGDPVAAAKAKQIEAQTEATMAKAKGDAQVTQIKTQATMQKHQADMQIAQQNSAFEQEMRKIEMAERQQDRQYDMLERQQEFQMQRDEAEQTAQMNRAAGVMDLQSKRQKMAQDAEAARQRAQHQPQGQG